jgi:putative flavoprotein involved in K+ transport
METIDTVVIGGGQAGLAAGYYLQRQSCEFVILDAHSRTGDSWRERWDSLRTFTAARYNRLDGMRFPGPGSAWPTKDQMAVFRTSMSVGQGREWNAF